MPARKKAVAKKTTRTSKPKKARKAKRLETKAYKHNGKETIIRPDVGTQATFKKKKEPVKYRFDRSLDPELSWDINADRERGEALIAKIMTAGSLDEAKAAADELKRMSRPFLNWAGKSEKQELTVPTLPLFVHERLSTLAILETLKGHKRDTQMGLFGDPQLDMADRLTKAYEHKDNWVNRMILGDSLLVMNSLIQYESLGGKVQMIYMDPPYGVKFGSNFQPFIRKRDVKHNDDKDFTREPEMVQAYRDTWELGLHSYLTYMRDRLLLCKELLSSTGSIFVQIGDENVHLVRCLLDEIYGPDNCIAMINFRTTAGRGAKYIDKVNNVLLWYARDNETTKYRQLFSLTSQETKANYDWVELPNKTTVQLTKEQCLGLNEIPKGRRYALTDLTSQGDTASGRYTFTYKGREYLPRPGRHWSTTQAGMEQLVAADRIQTKGDNIFFRRFLDDYPLRALDNDWDDTAMGGFLKAEEKIYVVQTAIKTIERCILMATDPGDIVLDPTCGSGTTAYIAEQWGRRWITIDVSRVPMALARQRVLTATFPYYDLLDEKFGINGGFRYERKKNSQNQDIGGIVSHITLKSIAQNEPPKEEVLVDRPNTASGVLRVSGPFTVEATLPSPVDIDRDGIEDSGMRSENIADYKTRMLETLRKVATLRIGNETVRFKSIKAPARSLHLDAEAEQIETDLSDLADDAALQKSIKMNPGKPVAFVFGPENGAVTERMVMEAIREANGKNMKHLFVIGFACQDSAIKLMGIAEQEFNLPVSYVSASMDLQMGDLLKNQRSSQVFAITGMPDIKLTKLKKKGDTGETLYQVELLGLDTFDPVTMDTRHMKGDDVPAWFLDTNYNDLVFYVNQAFFPRTSAWNNLKRSLKGVYDDQAWEHLAGAVSAPFTEGDSGKVAVKVIDDRGNELMIVLSLKDAAVER